MRRRDFIKGIASSATAWPLTAHAQEQPKRLRRLGVLMAYAEDDQESQRFVATFIGSLADLGWVNGRTVSFDIRWAGGQIDRMTNLAKELVELNPDVILANTTPVTAALHRQTQTIPIVFAIVSDPIGEGFVASLARPAGNITGFINLEGSIGGKWLELLKEAVPSLISAAIIFNPDTAPGGGQYFLGAFNAAAHSLGVEPIIAPVHSDADIESVIAKLSASPNSGLVVMTDGFLLVHRAAIIAATTELRVPAVYPLHVDATDGGLLAFGPYNDDLFRRAATYVDRILRGEKPADLPVQVPTKFELIVNLKTAKALNIVVPASILVRADEVIE